VRSDEDNVVSLHEKLDTKAQTAFALQLLDMSKFCITTITVILDLQILFHIEVVQMFIVPLHENFYIPSIN
jgi:hypothetical protein